jgi:DNA (cytosine-5)-methyltransferase 1
VKHSYVTVTDQFCGAGGSSLGAVASGAEVRLALNHWRRAIETHQANFPDVDHDCTDISACDPRRYPRTDILITSPECTNHSLAKGVKRRSAQGDLFADQSIDPAAERSRATMWDVPRFAEYHQYELIIVENVPDARHWVLWDAWLHAMQLLGYAWQAVYLNSMFVWPTPQSRDRLYVVFWKKGNRAPDLDVRPLAWCARCAADVESVQSWKNPAKPWGKYRQQYLYRCPRCAELVEPYYFAAANAIDWSLPAPRIGDRKQPLKEKTLNRIRYGLHKFGRDQLVSTNYFRPNVPVDQPWPTQTSANQHALLMPPALVDIVHSGGHETMTRSVLEAWRTQLGIQTQALVVPPFLVDLAYAHGHDNRSTRVDRPMPTQTSQQTQGVVIPPFIAELRNHSTVSGIDEALATVTAGGGHHGLVVPPFLLNYYGTDRGHAVDEPLGAVTTHDRTALVQPPFVVSYYTRSGNPAVSGMEEALPTTPGRAVHYLAQPGALPAVEDCGFRMLQPHEIGCAMAFPPTYRVLGTQREQVKQYGNAVTPPAMQVLIERSVATLG